MTASLVKAVERRAALFPVALDARALLERDGVRGFRTGRRRSANRSCHLLRARDGWVAINVAREDDREMIPALTRGGGASMRALERSVSAMAAVDFRAQCAELHLPAAVCGEATPAALAQGAAGECRRLKVVDLSALWAGPLCTGLLALAGAEVVRIESSRRRDPTPTKSPRLHHWLNGNKQLQVLDLACDVDRDFMARQIAQADVLVTSARARALGSLGLDDEIFARNPGLVWVAVTAHGWNSDRVGFGDDCAVAGGLVDRGASGPAFAGDALADPLTGLEAALAALNAVGQGSAGRIDLSLAGVAAAYRAMIS